MGRKEIVQKAKRVVVKLGTSVLTDASGVLDLQQIKRIVGDVAQLKRDGREVIVVSSGAIGAGIGELGLKERPKIIHGLQAAAAVGQSQMMRVYHDDFLSEGYRVAQILLTDEDLKVRARHLNARNTVMTLLSYGVIPIINENDTVSVAEIKFGDNDRLSALVTNLVQADLLILLTDIDGLMSSDPHSGRKYQLIGEVRKITKKIEQCGGGTQSDKSLGGMVTKIEAAKIVANAGGAVIIVNGFKEEVIGKIFRGLPEGTFFYPQEKKIKARKQWIAFFVHPKGIIRVDTGAEKALKQGGKSLLASGIVKVEGKFKSGDTVRICSDADKEEFGRGLVNYSSDEVRMIRGCKTQEIAAVLGYKYYDEVIHRDNLVILEEKGK